MHRSGVAQVGLIRDSTGACSCLIALWRDPAVSGGGGVWVIDARDWSVHSVDDQATDVRVAPNTLVTWDRRSATGVTGYRPGGTLLFHALPGKAVSNVGVTARYGYVEAGGRFSLDLGTGRVTGPLRNRADLVLPDLLDLP